MNLVKNDFLDLGRKQAQLFVEDNITYCEILVTGSCPRKILLLAYRRLVSLRKITPIEDMLLEHKESAWQMAKDIAKGRLGRQALIETVQAMMVIEYFLNQ